MYKHSFLVLLLSFVCSLSSQAQDLAQKIPGEANFITTINTKAFFDQIDVDDLNKTLGRLGLFDKINKDKASTANRLQDIGIDLNAKSYVYVKGTDSVQYVGALIPLSNKGQFQAFLPTHKKIEQVNGLSTIYSADRTIRMSWDERTIYVLGGIVMPDFFKQEDVMQRYGLIADMGIVSDAAAVEWNAYDYDELAADSAVVADVVEDTYDYDELVIDSVGTVEEEEEVVTIAPMYAEVDSVLALPQYSDNYYSRYDSVYRHNDSIQRTLVRGWLDTEMGHVVSGQSKPFDTKKLPKLSSNVLAQVYVTDIAESIQRFYPADIWRTAFGMNAPKIDYGIQELAGTIAVDKNKLVMTGTATFDKEMAGYYKAIYDQKLNPKFHRYLDKDVLGFFSFNVNTEAYIKHFPDILEKYYGAMMPGRESYVSLVTTLLDVTLDEKAIAKVFKGDNLFVLNGVTKMDVAYTDYEYDDDYNLKTIEKTRKETIPQFLWMFSSDDTRIFEKLISVGISENAITESEGIYEIKAKASSGIRLLVLMKDNMVFLGNDMDKIRSIQSNTLRTKAHAPYVSLVKKNKFSLLFNTRQVPTLVDDLGLPVDRSFEENIEELAQYGDFYMTSGRVKGNKLSGEVALEFPAQKGNVLQFILNTIDRWSTKNN